MAHDMSMILAKQTTVLEKGSFSAIEEAPERCVINS
jgi:hypothetical protein